MQPCSKTHCVLIPSYNTGPKLAETVSAALRMWSPVYVVIDGSTDGSDQSLEPLLKEHPDKLHVFRLAKNSGKGSAVLYGVKKALENGLTHVLTMDADGQHASDSITTMMEASKKQPHALVLGLPQFDDSAPLIRLRGRRIANFWARLETQSDIGDCLFGLRVYPAKALADVMGSTMWARRFDFDPEVAMRLVWRGHPPVNVPAPCRYFSPAEGGVSHFNYYRDNVLLTWMFARLFFGFLLRLPLLIPRRLHSRTPA